MDNWPRFAVGTASLRLGDAPERCSEIIHLALSAGMNWFDTAPLYVGGEAESALGQALTDIDRAAYRLSTKTGYVMNEQTIVAMKTGDPRLKRYPPLDFSYDFTVASIERSFARLNVPGLNAVFLHDPTSAHLRDVEAGAMRVLERMKQQGLTRLIGIGVSSVEAALAYLGRVRLDVIMLAGQYTLLVRDAGEELLGRCAELGVAVFAAGAFNSGLLADPFAPAPRFNYGPAPRAMVEHARRLHALCNSFHVPLRAAALQYPLRHPSIRAVVTGPSSFEELKDLIELKSLLVPPQLWAALEREESIA